MHPFILVKILLTNLLSFVYKEISKYEIVKEWEDFKNKRILNKDSERYGLRLFKTMQSSFMPLNEPNFGDNYVVDYGELQKENYG